MDEDERAPIIPLVPRGPIEGEPLPLVPLDRYDPIGDIAHRLGVSRRTAAGYYSRALKAVREAAETSPTETVMAARKGVAAIRRRMAAEWQQNGRSCR